MEDCEAITRCRAGDTGAFRHLVKRYEREAFAHALAITRSREMARDAMQEAFVDAWKNLGRFDLSRRFYPWLYTLLRNRCLKQLTKSPARTSEQILESRGAGSNETELRIALEAALATLTPEERELVVLKDLDGLTYADIGERLGIPAGTVMSRLFYVRDKLRSALTDAEGREEHNDERRRHV